MLLLFGFAVAAAAAVVVFGFWREFLCVIASAVLELNLYIRLSWNNSQGSACLCFLSAEVKSECYQTLLMSSMIL